MNYRLLIAALLAIVPGMACAENDFSVGVEGFRDNYREGDVSVNTHTDYGSVTGDYMHEFSRFDPRGDRIFVDVDGRYSQGKADYKSASGVLDNIPEMETDARLKLGIDYVMWHGHLMPYVGVGWRYFFQQGKGMVSNLGALAYDRHISQFYIPLGATYKFSWGGFQFAPMAEFDALANGHVMTHLAPIGVDENILNIQTKGYGWRGEFMVGQQYKYFGWEAGPFIRYWNIKDSSCKETAATTPTGTCWEEPANTRLQAGGAFRVNF